MGRGRGRDSSPSGGGSFSGGSPSRGFSGGSPSRSDSGRGGGRSSTPSYSSPSPSYSSPRPSYSPPPRYDRYNDRYDRRYSRPSRPYHSRTPLLDSCVSWLIVGVIVVFFLFRYWIPQWDGSIFRSSSTVENTVQREKIDSSALNKVGVWLEDNAGWLKNKGTVENGMKHFLDKTGIQPYLMINDEINGKKDFTDNDVKNLMESKYNSLFKDEAHLILLFVEPTTNNYKRYIYTGTVANTLMDSNALDIMYNYIDKYYSYDLTDDEYFSKIFIDTADKLMQKVVSKNELKKTGLIRSTIIILIAGIIMIIVIRSKAKQKEYEKAKEILDKEI